MGFAGVMCGKRDTRLHQWRWHWRPQDLLAWKGRLSGFSLGITEAELRSAILLGILAFVIFPVLPSHTVDPWHLVDPRSVWTSVLLIAAIGFGNYILLKIYGSRGVEAASFLAGLVDVTVAVTRACLSNKHDSTFCGHSLSGHGLATTAMLLRNGILLGILAPSCLVVATGPLLLMLVVCGGLAFGPWARFDSNGRRPSNLIRPFHSSKP